MLELQTRTEIVEEWAERRGDIIATAHGSRESIVLLSRPFHLPPRPDDAGLLVTTGYTLTVENGAVVSSQFRPLAMSYRPTNAEIRQTYAEALRWFSKAAQKIFKV